MRIGITPGPHCFVPTGFAEQERKPATVRQKSAEMTMTSPGRSGYQLQSVVRDSVELQRVASNLR